MGQQQLLLLVLGIVIVGLAVVAGIQAFGENSKKSNSDAMVNDAVRIANDAQAWAMKPTAFGGGNNSFVGIDFERLGYVFTEGENDDPDLYTTVNGEYELSGIGTSTLTITGRNTQHGNQVVVAVTGFSYTNIETTVSNL